MAKLPEGIFGGFRGRIGNVIGVKRGDTFYVKAAPSHVHNPNTPKQQSQRSRLGTASGLTSQLAPFINTSFSTIEGKTCRGACISYNMKAALHEVEGEIVVDYNSLIVSAGVLLPLDSPVAERISEGKVLRVTWTNNSGKSNALSTDRVMLLALPEEESFIHYSLNAAQRRDQQALLELPRGLVNRPVHLYLSLMSDDKSLTTNSVWLGKV